MRLPRAKDTLFSAPNPSRSHLEAWLTEIAAGLQSGARLLDAGAGRSQYRHLFAHTVYESADFEQVDKAYGDTTYVCDLAQIPVEDERFDAIICTQVLEHVPEPRAVLSELCRVLKPGARLYASAPLFYEEHEQPYDFFRYTRYGWERLAADSGFELEEIAPLEGYYATLSYQLVTAAQRLPRGMVVLRIAFGLLARWFARRELRAPYEIAGICKNYRCVLAKGQP
jgi:SAM-dependent methyltransferase